MKTAKDLTGQKFGKLTVLEKVGADKRYNALWLCKCDCGNEKIITRDRLVTGHSKSCGCLRKENCIKHTKHGLTHARIHRIWAGIKRRCTVIKDRAYKYYGGRGIKMCEEWFKNSKAFIDWAYSNGYSDNLTIERIDVNGNYEPSNCKWIDIKEQQRNKRSNKKITFKNQTHSLIEWAEILSIDYKKLKARLRQGWDFEKSITTPFIR